MSSSLGTKRVYAGTEHAGPRFTRLELGDGEVVHLPRISIPGGAAAHWAAALLAVDTARMPDCPWCVSHAQLAAPEWRWGTATPYYVACSNHTCGVQPMTRYCATGEEAVRIWSSLAAPDLLQQSSTTDTDEDLL